MTVNYDTFGCALHTRWVNWLQHDPYLRLHINYTHLLGLHRANSLYAGAILVLLVLPMFYEPEEKQQNINFSSK